MTDIDKPAFARTMARLAVALREPAPDVAMLQVYFVALKDREIEFLVMAAEQLTIDAKWFPKTSEWHAAALKVEADRRRALDELQRKSVVRLCEACEDTGWRQTDDGRARRCECRHLRRDELLGRRPWPALPARIVPDDPITDGDVTSIAETIQARTGVKLTPRAIPSTWRTRQARRQDHGDDEGARD